MKEQRRFKATDDGGNVYTVVERQRMVKTKPLSATPQELGGALDYVLSDGRDLNPNDDGTFTIVQTDEVLRPVE